jgi:superoxide dismutase, Cu-Zn family
MRKLEKSVMSGFWCMIMLMLPSMIIFGQNMPKSEVKHDIQRAICVLNPTEGNTVTGTITFTQSVDGVVVKGDIKGLSPGKHGFHIHEFGDCSSPDGTSAGGHFNPMHMEHGAPTDMKRHEGDMGNIIADASGNAHIEYTDGVIKLNGTHSIVGRGIIVHQGEDDLKSQPTGNAGSRVACGVIGVAK